MSVFWCSAIAGAIGAFAFYFIDYAFWHFPAPLARSFSEYGFYHFFVSTERLFFAPGAWLIPHASLHLCLAGIVSAVLWGFGMHSAIRLLSAGLHGVRARFKERRAAE